jgi:lysophospholipase L1-like esterase
LNQYHFVGRVTRTEATRFSWSGTSLVVSFVGTALRAELDEVSDQHRYLVIIDSEPQLERLRTQRGKASYTLCEGLSSEAHEVILYRLTEAFFGETQLVSLFAEQGGPFVEVASTRRYIEVIGDSISTGYGNEGADYTEPFGPDTQNHYLSYGAITARNLETDLVCVAWAGKGVFSNRGSISDTVAIPFLWSKTLYQSGLIAKQSGPDQQSDPEAVVINLGTNDLCPENPDWTPFSNAYLAFVRQVRARYQSAAILCTIGPMLNDSWPKERQALSTARQEIAHTVETLNREGDSKVDSLEFAGQDGSLGYGCDWHPNVATHQQMARQLEAKLRSMLAW